MKNVLVSAIALTALAGSAMAQSPYGSVEFRWRERAVGVTNTVNLPAGASAFAGANLDAVSSPTVSTDARFVLVLEARVTRAAGNSDLKGLAGVAFNLVSSDNRSQGQFAASIVSGTDKRNAAPSTTGIYSSIGAYTALPAGQTALPGAGTGERGVFGPFRRVADLGGNNQPAIGVQNNSTVGPLANKATLENVTIAASVDPLTAQVDTDDDGVPDANGPYFGRNDFYGLNTFVPIFTAVYNLADLTGRGSITISAEIAGAGAGDTGVRGFRGINNPVGNIDSWTLDTTGIPNFTIVIPAPGAAALAGLGGLMITRRRRA